MGGLLCPGEPAAPPAAPPSTSKWAAGANGDWALVPAVGLLPFHALPGTNPVGGGELTALRGGVGGEGVGGFMLEGGVDTGGRNSEGGVSDERTGVELRLEGVVLGVVAIPGIGIGAVDASFANEGVLESPSPLSVLMPSAEPERKPWFRGPVTLESEDDRVRLLSDGTDGTGEGGEG